MTELEKLHLILRLSEEVGVAVHEEVKARIHMLEDKQIKIILPQQGLKRLITNNNTEEQERRFRVFLSKTKAPNTINSYVSAMNTVSSFVHKYVDVSVQSVFAITDGQLMQYCFDILQRHKEFEELNADRHGSLSAAIKQYILFLR